MKIFVIAFLFFFVPVCLQAQTFPLGKSKEEVREFRATVPHTASPLSQSDTCDVYQIGELIQAVYYYKDNVCYKSKQIYSLFGKETMVQAIASMQSVFNNRGLKKVRENIWTTGNGTEQIQLIIIENTNQYAVEISSISYKN